MREFRYLSTDPSFPVSCQQTLSAPPLLSAQIPEGSVLSHQDAVGNTETIFFFRFFFLHSCIPGNAEGLRNHISDGPAAAAAAVTLLRVKEQACPQHCRSSSHSVPVEPQTRQGMGGSRKGGDDGGLILTGTGKSGRQHEEK